MKTKLLLITAFVLTSSTVALGEDGPHLDARSDSLSIAPAEANARERLADPNAPENSARNVRDRNEVTKTPMDQGNSTSDRNIAAQIRRAVVKDGSLSMNAHNVKIIVENGNVTLRGPVNSEHEKSVVTDLAQGVVGSGHMMDEIEVTGQK